MATTTIEWTDATWNPVRGCVKVSPGCKNCYAETFAERWRGVPGHPYEQGFDLRLVPEKLTEPLRRKQPTTYFVNSMSDLFQDGVPDEYIDQVFAVMALSPDHTFQVLTKRPARMLAYLSSPNVHTRVADAMDMPSWLPSGRRFPRVFNWPLPNLWLGVSVENQHFADERIPLLLQTPAAVRFISAEPLLGELDVSYWLRLFFPGTGETAGFPNVDRGLDWVIVGGESGAGARPFDLAWARSIVAQCQSAGVPVFVKQLGAMPIAGRMPHPDDMVIRLKSRKGGVMSEWPEDLRVRQMPAGADRPRG